MTIKVAVIGSGPSGFYTVDALLKGEKDVQIDIIDRLPTPFGLIRGGVAPDHQTTKKVARVYEKSALADGVAYYGNVEVGRDVSIEELKDMYDAIVLAVGAPRDRKLGIPGEDKIGVYGSADFVGWYNGHPDFTDLAPDLNTPTVVVIGNGNVAVDAARVLVKTEEEMTATDLADHAVRRHSGVPHHGCLHGRPPRPHRSQVHECGAARDGQARQLRAGHRRGASFPRRSKANGRIATCA